MKSRRGKIGVAYFPGTNCQAESKNAIEACGVNVELVQYQLVLGGQVNMLDYIAWLIAGGFSWGDHYLSGRIAGKVMRDKFMEFVATGRPLLGICNGDQVIFEAGLFDSPTHKGGALVQNACGHFVSPPTGIELVVEKTGTPWTEGIEGAVLRMPVAHGEGRWLPPEGGAPHLTPAYRYVRDGKPTMTFPHNPSGSPDGIAGFVYNNVCGMMPHPERVAREELGYAPGLLIIRNFVNYALGA
ncbi:MAG: phosphoribosylformylglycinamidine synthase subunit PurQ [Candidatus Berkelbacteria bacterium]|nr:phosphoribosylformylglycinamidine synthase subunit PurQ [Candidatus Berkelbacteria bacterium]